MVSINLRKIVLRHHSNIGETGGFWILGDSGEYLSEAI